MSSLNLKTLETQHEYFTKQVDRHRDYMTIHFFIVISPSPVRQSLETRDQLAVLALQDYRRVTLGSTN